MVPPKHDHDPLVKTSKTIKNIVSSLDGYKNEENYDGVEQILSNVSCVSLSN